MGEYRVYFIDPCDGIADAQWLDAATDEQAMSEAKPLKSHFTREVWENQRQVGRIAACASE